MRLRLAVWALWVIRTGRRIVKGAVKRAERIRWPRIETRDVVIVALLVLSFLFQAHDQNESNHSWCSTLSLLTSHAVPKPADPAANPSRVQAYRYYTVFLEQWHRLGCG